MQVFQNYCNVGTFYKLAVSRSVCQTFLVYFDHLSKDKVSINISRNMFCLSEILQICYRPKTSIDPKFVIVCRALKVKAIDPKEVFKSGSVASKPLISY